MEPPGEVIGCSIEDGGTEVCECCRGMYYNSKRCKEIQKDEDHQLINAKSDIEQVTIFIVTYSGVIDKLLVLDTPELADEHTKKFLEDYEYSNLEEYQQEEMTGHPKNTFKVYTKEILYEVE